VLRERTAAMNMVAMSNASKVQRRRKAARRWNVVLLVEGCKLRVGERLKGAPEQVPFSNRPAAICQQTSNLATTTSFHLYHLLHLPLWLATSRARSVSVIDSLVGAASEARPLSNLVARDPATRNFCICILLLSRIVRVASASAPPGSHPRPQQLLASCAAVSRWSIACPVHCRGERGHVAVLHRG